MQNREIVFALASWTIRRDADKFFVAKTQHWNGKHDWSKPYSSLTSAANAIARHLEREFSERASRRTKFERRFDRRYKRKAA